MDDSFEGKNPRKVFEQLMNDLLTWDPEGRAALAKLFGFDPDPNAPITFHLSSGKIVNNGEDGPEAVYLCQCGKVTRIDNDAIVIDCPGRGFTAKPPS